VPNHKSTLCQFLGKALHKSLEKSDVQFTTVRTGNGYQSTCQCPNLPAKYRTDGYVGEIYTDKKAAEQSAAGAALKAIQRIPELVMAATATKEDKTAALRTRWAEQEQAKYAREVEAQVVAGQILAHRQQQAAALSTMLAAVAEQQRQSTLAAQLQQLQQRRVEQVQQLQLHQMQQHLMAGASGSQASPELAAILASSAAQQAARMPLASVLLGIAPTGPSTEMQ